MSRRKQRKKEVYKEQLVDYNITPKTTTQKTYLVEVDKNSVIFASGPAGTGKTICAIAKACQYLEEGKVKQIILTRPLQDAEADKLGILPGELDDKFGPYLLPMMQYLNQFLGASKVSSYVKNKKIVGIPLALARGYTFDNAFIIASEMQNSSPTTMKLILTRLGKYTKLVVDGDSKQKDIRGLSGLEDARAKLHDLQGVSFIEFTTDDIVRSDIVKHIIERYEHI